MCICLFCNSNVKQTITQKKIHNCESRSYLVRPNEASLPADIQNWLVYVYYVSTLEFHYCHNNINGHVISNSQEHCDERASDSECITTSFPKFRVIDSGSTKDKAVPEDE